MTAAIPPGVVSQMRVHRRDRPVIACQLDGVVEGVEECDEVELEFLGLQGRVLVDDVELARMHNGYYPWRPAFMAGQVEVLLLVDRGIVCRFRVTIAPSTGKASPVSFEQMMAAIRSHRPALLIGDNGARDAFGSGPERITNDLLRLSRLATHGPRFVSALRRVTESARPAMTQKMQSIPLTRARKVQASALRDRRLAALVTGQADAEVAARLTVRAQVVAPTSDTPLHRALKALALRIHSAGRALLERVENGQVMGDSDDQALRKPRRMEVLAGLLSELAAALRSEPFSSVRRAEVTAAGLTQIAASPAAAAAYHLGVTALDLGVGDAQRDQLAIKPTWGIYESWCFVELHRRLQERLGAWSGFRSPLKADDSAYLEMANGGTLELHFQAPFAAVSESRQTPEAWSVSRQRIPDILLVVRGAGWVRYGILDAKYRRHRRNVLEAMESAHLYRDSLRIGKQRADFCYLLLPAEADVRHLNDDACHAEHQVGTVCGFAPGGPGIDRCIEMIVGWINGMTGRASE